MKKAIKLIAALTIIGTTFTSCTQDETPIPQIQLEDFEATYQYLTGTDRVFEIEVFQEFDRWTGVTTSDVMLKMNSIINPERNPETLTNLQRVDSKSFSCEYRWDGEYFGEALIFIDNRGVRKLTIEHTNGGLYKAIEVE